MLTELLLKNFKIHRDLKISLGNLNVFTGLNSSGKSSVIQMLLLLRQSMFRDSTLERLQLNGDLCEIGFAGDALNQNASGEDGIGVSLSTGGRVLTRNYRQRTFSYNEDVLIADSVDDTSAFSEEPLFNTNFQYISAARWAPRDSYPLDSTTVVSQRQISKEKGMCEFIAHFINHYGIQDKYIVPVELRHPFCESGGLMDQITYWEGEISSHVNVIVEQIGKGFALRYSYRREDGLSTDDYSAVNVGFGLSYALPIVVALLTAQKSSLIIVENPEAHLHSQGQAALMRLICRAANYGVQIILETHSDFILNGVLLGVKRQEEGAADGMQMDKVRLYHFSRNDKDQSSHCEEVRILEGGRIDSQPDGFFDQMRKDMKQLMGF